MHVYSIENKKLAYKLSTSTRVAFDVMITIAMSNALEFFLFWLFFFLTGPIVYWSAYWVITSSWDSYIDADPLGNLGSPYTAVGSTDLF